MPKPEEKPAGVRRALYEQIATLVAGHEVADVLSALADNLAQAAGFASKSPQEAEKLLTGMVPSMARSIREGWPYIIEAKARGALPAAEGSRA